MRHRWKIILAIILYFGPILRGLLWVIEKAGDAEFVASSWRRIMGVIGEPWFALIAIPAGLLLIWWHVKHARRDDTIQLQPVEELEVRAREETHALASLVVQGRRRDSQQIHKAFNPWRILYPLHLVNTSESPIDIVGWNRNLLLDDSPITRITWRAPDGEASNGLPLRPNMESVEAYTIQAGQPYTITVPINRRDITDLPRDNPIWGARGNIYIRWQGEDRAIPFNFDSDHYQLEQEDWVEWASQ